MRRTGTLPGLLTGLLTGVLMGALAARAGAPGSLAVAMAAGLGLPLGLLGAGYDRLLERGRVRPGGMAEAVVYWTLAFPLARAVQQAVLAWGSGQPPFGSEGAPAFLSFQAMVGGIYGLGFVLLRARVAGLLRWGRGRAGRAAAG